MKPLQHVIFWLLISAVGYVGGRQSFGHVFQPAEIGVIMGVAASIFTVASVSLGLVLKLYDTPPSKLLDGPRADYWRRKFNSRWAKTWICWAAIFSSGLATGLAVAVLTGKISIIAPRTSVAVGSAGLLVGSVALAKCIFEVFTVRRVISKVEIELERRQKLQATLLRLDASSKDP